MEDQAGELPDALFRAAVAGSNGMTTIADSSGTIVWANDGTVAQGWDRSDVIGHGPLEFLHPDDVERAALAVGATEAVVNNVPSSYLFRQPDGSFDAMDAVASVFEHDGRGYLMFNIRPNAFNGATTATLSALAGDRPVADVLGVLAARMSAMVEGMDIGIAFDGRDGDRTVVGPIAAELAGVIDGAQDRTPGKPWADALDRGSPVTIDTVDALPDPLRGAAVAGGYTGATFLPVAHPAATTPALYVVWFSDVVPPPSRLLVNAVMRRTPLDLVRVALERAAARQRLEHLALHDSLTGLANRVRFLDELERCSSGEAPFAVLFVDLDDFKPINDRLGHLVGDHVLTVVADRFRSAVGSHDVVARLGGDEFGVLCREVPDVGIVEAIANRLLAATADPIDGVAVEAAGADGGVGASIGAAFVPEPDGMDADDLLAAADAALYSVKRGDKGTVAVTVVTPFT